VKFRLPGVVVGQICWFGGEREWLRMGMGLGVSRWSFMRIVWADRKFLFFLGIFSIENEGATFLVFDEKTGITKVFNHGVFALNPGVGDGANLLRIEFLPSLPIELFEKRWNVFSFDEIDEGVPYVTLVLKINR